MTPSTENIDSPQETPAGQLIKVIARTEGNHCRYYSWDDELLFEAIFEPENLFTSWFSRLQKLTFVVNGQCFEITSTVGGRAVEVTQGFKRVAFLEYARSELFATCLKFRWYDNREVIAGTFATHDQCWRCVHASQAWIFDVHQPWLGDLTASWKTFFKVLHTVGELDLTRKHDPAIAILFMYIDLFLQDRGGTA